VTRTGPARTGPVHTDQGFTLLEVLISMGIMSIVLAVVTGAIVQIYSATTQVDTTTSDRDQLTVAFRRLDKELRYAQWIATPGLVGTRYYVEYAMPGGGCRQLKYDGGVLSTASWVLPSTTPGTPTALASGLTLISGTAPFTLYAAGSAPYASASAGTAGVGKNFSPEHALLRLQFNAVAGRTTAPFDTIFAAQNTSRNTSALSDCSAGRPSS
jgi:prepilin-type N-terminal cleavage/methylation domain-containing protein